jgi:hypothetical protein
MVKVQITVKGEGFIATADVSIDVNWDKFLPAITKLLNLVDFSKVKDALQIFKVEVKGQ